MNIPRNHIDDGCAPILPAFPGAESNVKINAGTSTEISAGSNAGNSAEINAKGNARNSAESNARDNAGNSAGNSAVDAPCQYAPCQYAPRRRAAMTIIEVLIALTIVIIVGSVVFAGATDLSRRMTDGRTRQTARWLLQARLTELETHRVVPGHRSEYFAEGYENFRHLETITPMVYAGRTLNGVFHVRLQILWQTPNGLEAMSAETCVAQYPDSDSGDDSASGNGTSAGTGTASNLGATSGDTTTSDSLSPSLLPSISPLLPATHETFSGTGDTP